MAKDTTDNTAFVPHALGDLDDVDAAVAPTVDKSSLQYNLAGTEWRVQAPQAAQADVATPDGSDAGTTQTLANALKVAHNALLAKLRLHGVLAP